MSGKHRNVNEVMACLDYLLCQPNGLRLVEGLFKELEEQPSLKVPTLLLVRYSLRCVCDSQHLKGDKRLRHILPHVLQVKSLVQAAGTQDYWERFKVDPSQLWPPGEQQEEGEEGEDTSADGMLQDAYASLVPNLVPTYTRGNDNGGEPEPRPLTPILQRLDKHLHLANLDPILVDRHDRMRECWDTYADKQEFAVDLAAYVPVEAQLRRLEEWATQALRALPRPFWSGWAEESEEQQAALRVLYFEFLPAYLRPLQQALQGSNAVPPGNTAGNARAVPAKPTVRSQHAAPSVPAVAAPPPAPASPAATDVSDEEDYVDAAEELPQPTQPHEQQPPHEELAQRQEGEEAQGESQGEQAAAGQRLARQLRQYEVVDLSADPDSHEGEQEAVAGAAQLGKRPRQDDGLAGERPAKQGGELQQAGRERQPRETAGDVGQARPSGGAEQGWHARRQPAPVAAGRQAAKLGEAAQHLGDIAQWRRSDEEVQRVAETAGGHTLQAGQAGPSRPQRPPLFGARPAASAAGTNITSRLTGQGSEGGQPVLHPPPRKRKPWTLVEEHRLMELYRVLGSCWSTIKARDDAMPDSRLTDRDQTQIKDKIRNLKKAGRIELPEGQVQNDISE